MTRPSLKSAPPRRPGRPRQDGPRAAEVRLQLLDAATELAIEQGFDACGLREIAARAGVSPGMIAYYFGDRRGLYEAMFRRAIDRVRAQVEALLAEQENNGDDRLDEIVRIHVTAMAAEWVAILLWLHQVVILPKWDNQAIL